MSDHAPYVEATTHLPVDAEIRGQRVEGRVLGWRDDRVHLTWKSDMGSHLGWAPASVVEQR